jgi:hypothetical protein
MNAIIQYFADAFNKGFKDIADNYLSLKERLDNARNNTEDTRIISDAVNAFKRNNSHITRWEDIQLCTVGYTTLDRIIIDTTLQRNLLVRWVAKILSKFISHRVLPIKVYVDAARPNVFICWDGQHTAIMLLIICIEVLGLDPKNCQVPIIITPATQKKDMRGNFLSENTEEGRTQVGNSEIWRQHVLGVRIDKSDERLWVAKEKRQTYLEENKLFVCEEKTNASMKPGAITNMSELTNFSSYSPEVIQNVARFLHLAGVSSSRPVASTEMWQLGNYFAACSRAKVVIDDAYITTMIDVLTEAFGSYNPHRILAKAHNSYDQAYLKREDNFHGTLRGTGWNAETRKPYHAQYLTAILARHSELKVPGLSIDWDYDPAELELGNLKSATGLLNQHMKVWYNK